MSTSVTMPQLGESVTEGTVTRWLKQEGDEVTADEPLLEVSTDKVDTEIPSPASGVLRKIVVAEDETVQIGAELAVIGDAGDGDSDGGDSDGGDSEGGDPASSDNSGETDRQVDSSGDESADAGEDSDGSQAGAEADAGTANDQTAQHDTEQDSSADASAEHSSADEGAAPQPGGAGSGSGTSFTMPALGESVTEGTVTRWLKEVGDSVEVDEPLVEVSTDKVDTEIPAPSAGTLLSIAVAEDETVQVGAELGVIGSADGASDSTETADTADTDQAPAQEAEAEPSGDEDQSDSADAESTDTAEAESAEPAAAEKEDAPAEVEAAEPAPARREDSSAAPDAEPPSDSPSPTTTATPAASRSEAAGSAVGSAVNGDSGAYVTPLVRKLAAEHKVDLSALTGTGVGGRIRKQDVLDAAAGASQPSPATAPDQGAAESAAPATAKAGEAQQDSGKRGQTEKLTRLRAVIGKRMIESLQVSAQLTTVVEVDVTRVARLRDRVKDEFLAREGVKLSFLPFFALAAVESLKAHPTVNSSIDSEAGTVTYHDSENLGIAVDTERGLLVPVVQDAGDLNLGGLARKIADLAERTRSNQVTPDELGGGTFTLTNTGSRGALFDTPIINQPQVAILGTGTVVKRPVVVDDPELGEIVTVRSMVYLALTYDHRIVDGADAARFLVAMKDRLETGDFESSLGLS